MAVVRVLERLGLRVEFPEGQTCCGQPAFNGGEWTEARAMARHTLDVLGNTTEPIIVPSGSCADMLVHHYPELFNDDPVYGPIATRTAQRVFEFSQFLVEKLGLIDLGAQGKGRLVYHPSCHLLRGLNITEPPRQLLTHVAGVELVELPEATECCGFGGLFAIKMSELSSAMLDCKLNAIESVAPDEVVGCDWSCLLHIGGGLHRRGSRIRVRHLAEVLDADSESK